MHTILLFITILAFPAAVFCLIMGIINLGTPALTSYHRKALDDSGAKLVILGIVAILWIIAYYIT